MDITFNTSEGVFNYRVCAVILHAEKILAMHDERSPYFYLPGGRVNLKETAEHAVLPHVIPSSAIVVNRVNKTVRSMRDTPIQIMKYLFSFINSVFIIVTISLTPFLIKIDRQKKRNSPN